MTWLGGTVIETATGLAIDLARPKPEAICLDDIAHGLAYTCRFGGHSKRFYSVAEHSCFVSDIVAARGGRPRTADLALLHDAHEAYLGDIPTPLKRLIGSAYSELVDGVDDAIASAFGFDPRELRIHATKRADELALLHEATNLMPSQGGAWAQETPDRAPAQATAHWRGGVDPETARRAFRLRLEFAWGETEAAA